MASSNRHWPSMFRSTPACDFQQMQPDMNNNSSSPSSLISSPGSRGKPSLISSGIEESTRNPEPKPRWNPRPEQIRILEGIFNSGMVNPPRDEIRRIRLLLQEYGQVGDANVFYWFQNRKSRTKSKLRAAGQLQQPVGHGAALQARACASPSQAAAPAPLVTPPRHLLASPLAPPTSSSSSSSDRSSGSSKSVIKPFALASAASASQGMLAPSTAINLFSPTPSPALSACQLYYHSHPVPTPTAPVRELASPEPPSLLQWPQSQYLPATELGGVLGSSHVHTPAMHPAAVSPGALLGLCNEALGQDTIDMSCSKGLGQYFNNNTCTSDQLISHKTDAASAVIREDETARLGLLHYGFTAAPAAAQAAPLAGPVHAAVAAADVSTAILPCAAPSNAVTGSVLLTDQLQGLLDAGLIGGAPQPPATVVAVGARPDALTYYSVPAMMRLDVKLFGEAAVLLRCSGEPVLVDESGVTAEPLQQGAVYYVLVTN